MLSPGQGLLRVGALALWHLVGHPPQVTHLDKTNSTFCAQFMIMNVPCKFETTAFQGQKKEGNHNTVSSPWTCSAGTRRWSIFASPPVTSFVRQGHHWRPCPPAAKKRTSFTSFEKVHTHTQPTKTRAGYACATQHDMTWTRGTLKWDQPPKSTKTGQRRKETQQGPQTTVQQQQAEPQHSHQPTHTPNKSTGKQQDTRTPASKARPTDRRGTAAKQGPTDRPARFVYVSKVKKKIKFSKIITEPFHYHEHVQVGRKARSPAVFKLDSWQLSDWPRIDARLYLTKNQREEVKPADLTPSPLCLYHMSCMEW